MSHHISSSINMVKGDVLKRARFDIYFFNFLQGHTSEEYA
ncbi:hypothetical protein E1A91_A13G117600v1 [Gossypium mustelinum]|uniref:Uncharacterized protein n=1 Tax=Gossypium mustelinum TaxID=34275 RepID=A0A5D2WIW8_GOSMU|nr:hypothetical protein E1A91_A13G117600v1 [Gossypium mustelinum]